MRMQPKQGEGRYPERPVLVPPQAQAFLERVEMSRTDGMSGWRLDSVRRGESPIQGEGLIAVTEIPANTLVAIKQGHVLTEEEVIKRAAIIRGSQQQIGPDQFLAGRTVGEVGRNLIGYNHSCEPNARIMLFEGISLAFLVTNELIKPGIEVTVDYAVSETSSTHHLEPCQCHADNCRTVVAPESDWQSEELQRKYKGEFAWFVQDAIDAQRAGLTA